MIRTIYETHTLPLFPHIFIMIKVKLIHYDKKLNYFTMIKIVEYINKLSVSFFKNLHDEKNISLTRK